MIRTHSASLTLGTANNVPLVSTINRWFFREMKSLPTWPVTLVLALCISVAICTSGYLLWTDLTASEIAGCGSSGGWVDCGHVARSRWALWLGVPVSLLALGIYFTMAIALVAGSARWFSRSVRKVGWTVVTAAAFAAGLSAVWFVLLQLLVLKAICLYCMIAHACGLAAAATMLIASPLKTPAKLATAALSFAGFAVLVVGQMFTRPPDMHRIERFDAPSDVESEHFEFAPPVEKKSIDGRSDDNLFQAPLDDSQTSPPPSSGLASSYLSSRAIVAMPKFLTSFILVVDSSEHRPADRRLVAIQGGTITLDVAQWPLSGLKNAKYVFVELFDYNCRSCRKTHATIVGAKEKLGDQLAVICLPVPINSTCNPTVRVTNENNKESCDLANLAVAVWRVDETRFASFHDWMFQGAQAPSYAAAKAKAAKLVGAKQLDAELASGIPKQYVARHVEIYNKVGAGTIPKLMFPRTSVVGEYSSVDGLVDLIRHEAD